MGQAEADRPAIVSEAIPAGGHQTDWKKIEEYITLFTRPREEPRTMFPSEFLGLLWKFKHPRWPTIGVAWAEASNAARGEVGIRSHGTIYVANATQIRDVCAIPANEIPYATIRTAEWDEEQSRFVKGETLRGWRNALATLCSHSYLEPDDELSWYIAKDSFTLVPREYWR